MQYLGEDVYGVVYKLTSPSGKVYIGQTTNWLKRVSYYSGCHCKNQHKLYHAIKKYGWVNFRVDLIERAYFKEELDFLEALWIEMLGAMDQSIGYNLCTGGCTRGELSAESKAKYRASVLGQVRPSVAKANNPAARRVLCVTTGVAYSCMSEAQAATGAHVSAICNCCRCKRPYAGRLSDGTRLIWRYA